MERVASYQSPTSNSGDLSRLVPNGVRSSAASSSRFIVPACPKVVVVRADELSAETRDEPQKTSQRWDRETNWKPQAVASYERVFRETNGASRHIREVQLQQESSRRQNLRNSWNHQHVVNHHWYSAGRGRPSAQGTQYASSERPRHGTGGMVPVSAKEDDTVVRQPLASSYVSLTSRSAYNSDMRSTHQSYVYKSSGCPQTNSSDAGRPHSSFYQKGTNSSVVLIPKNIVIPIEIAPAPPKSALDRQRENSSPPPVGKRSISYDQDSNSPQQAKRAKNSSGVDTARLEGTFHKLDLLCSATLELGPLQDNPTGCSCPKSKCIALYCDCFKAGRRCDPNTCSCTNCKNTVTESGPNGARSKAIQSILARNPRAFTNAGAAPSTNKLLPGEQACNCIRSRCLKLYCTCFQAGKSCNANNCTCVGCLNTHEDPGGHRQAAIDATLEKRPDAFAAPKVKEIGAGCACKNNRCIRKYCECFRTQLACTNRCSCRDCVNQESDRLKEQPFDSVSSSSPSTVAMKSDY